MSFGRLLATGKSLVGLSGGASRYRVSKQVLLPKFITPKNPFVLAEAPAKKVVTGPLPVQPVASKPVVAVAGDVAGKAGRETLETLRASKLARSPGWFGTWGNKLNPRSWRMRSPAPMKFVARQGELSLREVRVVRNDLRDTDFEVGPPANTKPVMPVMALTALTAEKFEPVGAVWQRLATKFFGTDQH